MEARAVAGPMRTDMAPGDGPQPPLLVSYPTDGLGGLSAHPPVVEVGLATAEDACRTLLSPRSEVRQGRRRGAVFAQH